MGGGREGAGEGVAWRMENDESKGEWRVGELEG